MRGEKGDEPICWWVKWAHCLVILGSARKIEDMRHYIIVMHLRHDWLPINVIESESNKR